jgi:hypothetical protein
VESSEPWTPADPVSTLSAQPLAAAQPGQGKGDEPKGTVWVVNRDLGELAVFDAATGDLLATQPVGRGAHDVCISDQARKAYITAETDNAVTVVDTDTLATESIPVGPLPHHIEPSNDGHTIYVSLASHPTTQPAPGRNEYAAIDLRQLPDQQPQPGRPIARHDPEPRWRQALRGSRHRK